MNWQILEIWNGFGSGWVTIVGYLSILMIYSMTLISVGIDNKQINCINYCPNYKCHYIPGSRSMGSHLTCYTTDRGSNKNAPKYPRSLILKTVLHFTKSTTREIELTNDSHKVNK